MYSVVYPFINILNIKSPPNHIELGLDGGPQTPWVPPGERRNDQHIAQFLCSEMYAKVLPGKYENYWTGNRLRF